MQHAMPSKKQPGESHDPRRLLRDGVLCAGFAGDVVYQTSGGVMQLANLFREQLIRARIWWYELALTQIDPSHPDVPEIIIKLLELYDQRDSLKGKA